MLTLAYDYEPRVWLPVPTSFPDEPGETVEAWAARQAASAPADGLIETADSGPVDDYFMAVAEFAHRFGREHDDVWMLVAADAPGAVGFVLDVVDADRSLNDRLASYASPSQSQYERPAVQHLETPGLGEGFHVVRTDIAPDRQVYMTFTYVFRVDGSDVVLATQSFDTAALDWAEPRIREFIDGISVTEAAPTR